MSGAGGWEEASADCRVKGATLNPGPRSQRGVLHAEGTGTKLAHLRKRRQASKAGEEGAGKKRQEAQPGQARMSPRLLVGAQIL